MSASRKVLGVLLTLAFVLGAWLQPALASSPMPNINLVVNGTYRGKVDCMLQGNGIVVDARSLLAHLPGAEYYPGQWGAAMVIKYGDRISFAALQRPIAFCALQELPLDYPLQRQEGVLLAPLNFLASAVGATMTYEPNRWEVRVEATGQPKAIGDTIPQSKLLTQQLAADFTVRQGQICHASAIELFATGFVPDCNGNNAGFPYFIIQAPPTPRLDAYAQLPFVFQIEQDEAMVVIGYTPPQAKYYSYRSYMVNRIYPGTTTRNKIYASLGDTVNNYNLAQTWGGDDVYGRFIMLISTGNQTTYERVRQAALAAGIAPENIFQDIIADGLFKFGMGDEGDGYNFLHRVSLFNDADEKAAYIASPTLEILRVTPRQALAAAPLYQQPLRPRGDGTTEEELDPRLAATMEQLYQAILDKHGAGRTATRMDTSVWLVEGNQAIAEAIDVLGEVRDTLYTKTPNFPFYEDDLIVVFGVNHTKTGKSVYSNFSCYGADYFNGLGGITNQDYLGSARAYLPGVDPELADMFYVWKFAHKDQGDDTTFVVPTNANRDYHGIDYGDPVFMGFRSYIDKPTLVGTVIDEIVRDQAVLFR